MLDYLIVGLGLAGVSFSETLERNGQRFKVISDHSQRASLVAGGLYNPVVLKRFTAVWRSLEQMELLDGFYHELENKLETKLDHKVRVMRRFTSAEEQNKWFEAADKPQLEPFLSLKLLPNHNPNIHAPFGYGEVLHTGRVDTRLLLDKYEAYLLGKGALQNEPFDPQFLEISTDSIKYKDIQAKRLVMATGFGLKQDPFFGYLPMNGTKGELVTIRAPRLKEDHVIKSSVFIIPLGDDLYRIGATYKWKDKSNTPTAEAKTELLEKLETFLKCEYEVVRHVAGIRPTVTDRRPLVGQHPKYTNVYALNGFGSRGVMIAPYASLKLYKNIQEGEKLPPEMDINRFSSKYLTGEISSL